MIKRILIFVKNLLEKLGGSKYMHSSQNNLEEINLLLIRDTWTEKSTMGQLFLNGELFCDTLENPWKNNTRNISCIPKGKYSVDLRPARQSATRDYLHLILKDVPNRDYILVHRGNSAQDTRGCILVGRGTEQDIVYNSRMSMDLLMKEIITLGGENINLIIKNK